MSKAHPLYNIRRGPAGYQLGKFDHDLNLLAIYDTSAKHCSCPAGPRPTCKHRKMLPRMLGHVDTSFFYCYETQQWLQPLAEMEAEYHGNASEASSCPSEAEPASKPSIELPMPATIPLTKPATGGIRRR